MILIVCIDDKGGMMFGSRRQSKDSVLNQRILARTRGKKLFLSPYSAPLLEEKEELVILPDPAKGAGEGDFLFIENTPLPEEGIEGVLLYRWNRLYPATRAFDLSLADFHLTESADFTGSSHEKITEEWWKK